MTNVSDSADQNRRTSTGSFFRGEYPLLIGLGTAAVLFSAGDRILEQLRNPVSLALIFVWLFATILGSAISVVRHADSLAVKWGEPYGTLVLTLAAISIEVMMIATAMLHGANNPTLARDMMFAVIMIALNGLVGLALLLGGLRHHEQHYNLQGTNSYLNAIMALSVLGLILPNFTASTAGPRFSTAQEVFLVVTSVALYGLFVLLQTMRHSKFFVEPANVVASVEDGHHNLVVRSTAYHGVLLFLYLIAVILLAEKFAIPLDNSIEQFGMPQAFGGAIVAALILAPEALSALQAARRNHLQRSINILHGSVLASIGLTIPVVLTIGLVTNRPVALGMEGGNQPLLILTLATSIVTFASGKTNVLQGCIHLLLFSTFLLLIFCR